jgi:hypothetical protein
MPSFAISPQVSCEKIRIMCVAAMVIENDLNMAMLRLSSPRNVPCACPPVVIARDRLSGSSTATGAPG